MGEGRGGEGRGGEGSGEGRKGGGRGGYIAHIQNFSDPLNPVHILCSIRIQFSD